MAQSMIEYPELLGIASRSLDSGLTCTELLKEMHRAVLSIALMRNKGNMCHAAKSLGMHRNTLMRQMAEHGLDYKAFR